MWQGLDRKILKENLMKGGSANRSKGGRRRISCLCIVPRNIRLGG